MVHHKKAYYQVLGSPPPPPYILEKSKRLNIFQKNVD